MSKKKTKQIKNTHRDKNTLTLERNSHYDAEEEKQRKWKIKTIEFEMHRCMCVVAFLPAGKKQVTHMRVRKTLELGKSDM